MPSINQTTAYTIFYPYNHHVLDFVCVREMGLILKAVGTVLAVKCSKRLTTTIVASTPKLVEFFTNDDENTIVIKIKFVQNDRVLKRKKNYLYRYLVQNFIVFSTS